MNHTKISGAQNETPKMDDTCITPIICVCFSNKEGLIGDAQW